MRHPPLLTPWITRLHHWWARDRETRALGEQALSQGRQRAGALTRIGYGFRLAWHRREHRRLIDTLRGDIGRPELAEMLQANPLLAFKILHPCHQTGLSAAQRVDRVLAHHQALHALLGARAYRAVHIDRTGAVLAPLPLPGDALPHTLRLTRFARFWREGELTLALHAPDGALVYTLTFSVRRPPAGLAPTLLIGSLIGVASTEHIKRLTKQCHGLRPQALMVLAAQTLAGAWGLARVEAVGRAGHVFARTDRAGRLQFDYDAFWQALGGTLLEPQGRLWQLPLQTAQRPESDIPAHKRSQYRRRYRCEADIAQAVRAGLQTLTANDRAPASG